MAKDLFKRYIWLIDTIYRSKKITLKEINNKWLRADSEHEPIPNRTFHNHRAAIEDFFDIIIDCDKSTNEYYIENAEQLVGSTARNWLLNTLTVSNLVNESHKLKNRILFENIPSGQQYLTTIIEAMRDELTLEITYQPFWHDEAHTFEIEPYTLKIFKQRWYLLAYNPSVEGFRIYSLDRVQDLCATEKTFKLPKDFDAEIYFENSFGIIVDENIEPCVVKIKTFGQKSKYFQTLPLHASQEEVERAEDYSVFSYFISPTYDFRQEILSHSDEVEVLEPMWFREEIRGVMERMGEMYFEK
ncbi:MAG: WYL domain-containing protein [Dysgonamonadaceae bacterium]|jgi:hypothetical protein|nr:WYL domain-containing protein [Dysgonamonadaceae bacterium]